MKIQIAEDNPNHLDDAVSLVREACPAADVIQTPTFESALSVAMTGPDVLIVDARLSADKAGLEWEGVEVAEAARAANRNTCVILVSAFFQGTEKLTRRQRKFRVIEKGPNWLDELRSICNELAKAPPARKVFLSYARADKDMVHRLYFELRKNDIDPWWDDDIPAGHEWEETIRGMVRNSDFFLACVGESYSDREGLIQKELRWACDRASEKPKGRAYIIPVRLTSKSRIPEQIDQFQFVDLFLVDGLSRLLDTLRGNSEK